MSAPCCASCSGGADPDRVLAVAGRCACGAFGALYLPRRREQGAAMKPPIHLGRVVDLAAIFHGRERNVEPEPESVGRDRQQWRCITCRAIRQWGYGKGEATMRPYILCEGECGVHTPHVYVGVR